MSTHAGEIGPGRSARGAQTRESIVSAAHALFLERGYEATTMRAVAERAGVSLGNAYYYFASKDHLVQSFYEQLQRDHADTARAALRSTRGFSDRLVVALETWVEVAAELHPFGGSFFRAAGDPGSSLSPFSAESTPAREEALALYACVVEGADLRLPDALREQLPELLWLVHMGIVLFWVHDRSEATRRTRTLIRGIVPILDKMLRLTRLPGVRGVALDVVALTRSIHRHPDPTPTAE